MDRHDNKLSFFIDQNIRQVASKFLRQFVSSCKNSQLYPAAHPYLLYSLQLLYDTLQELFVHKEKIVFNVIEQELYFDNIPLIEESLRLQQLIQTANKHHIGNFVFSIGITKEELLKFINIFMKEPEKIGGEEGLARHLTEENITHIRVGQATIVSKSEEKELLGEITGAFAGGRKQLAKEIFFQAINVIKATMHDVEHNKVFNLTKVQELINALVENIFEDKASLLELTPIKNYDDYTFNHSVNVAIFSLSMGSLLGFKKEYLKRLGEAAFLHDIGKIKIPQEILNKPGPLTEEEWKLIKRHPWDAVELLCRVSDIDKLTMVVAFEHHLQYDLSGYPEITSKRPLHFFTRIVNIADFYDAITTFRVYHPPIPPFKAINILWQKRGIYFDPTLVKVFINMVGIYPIGSLVRLDTQELGLVIHTNANNLLRPKIIIVNPAQPEETFTVDLEEIDKSTMKFKRSIVESLDPLEYNIDIIKYF